MGPWSFGGDPASTLNLLQLQPVPKVCLLAFLRMKTLRDETFEMMTRLPFAKSRLMNKSVLDALRKFKPIIQKKKKQVVSPTAPEPAGTLLLNPPSKLPQTSSTVRPKEF